MKEFKVGIPMDDLVKPVRDALHRLYSIRQKSEFTHYDGFAYTDHVSATSVSPEKALSFDGLKMAASNYNDDPMDVILGIAFKLGYCQGYASAENRMNTIIDIKDRIIDALTIKKEPEKKE